MRLSFIALCLGWLLFSQSALAVEITLDRPGDREFIRDNANLLTESDHQEIQQLCDKLLTDKATPIIVITIDRMANHGGDGLRIETFARLLFDQWEIGHAKIDGQPWNTGILLLISKGDRLARIELGNGWGREKDAVSEQVMQEQIIPRFKNQDFSAGIKAGVIGLEAMARERPLPAAALQQQSSTGSSSSGQSPIRQGSNPLLLIGLAGMAIFTVVSLARRGSDGWAWIFWGVVLSFVGLLLYSLLTSRRSSGGGGGFSGGSFGGGYSGGGGASGSW